MTSAAGRDVRVPDRRAEGHGLAERRIRFLGTRGECAVPVAFAELLSRELRRISVDARDAASSAARRIEVALSVDGDEAGPLPAREAAAIQIALARPATSRAASAPVEALRDMLALEYGDHAST